MRAIGVGSAVAGGRELRAAPGAGGGGDFGNEKKQPKQRLQRPQPAYFHRVEIFA